MAATVEAVAREAGPRPPLRPVEAPAKACRVCGAEKPLTLYPTDQRQADGRAQDCGLCIAKSRELPGDNSDRGAGFEPVYGNETPLKTPAADSWQRRIIELRRGGLLGFHEALASIRATRGGSPRHHRAYPLWLSTRPGGVGFLEGSRPRSPSGGQSVGRSFSATAWRALPAETLVPAASSAGSTRPIMNKRESDGGLCTRVQQACWLRSQHGQPVASGEALPAYGPDHARDRAGVRLAGCRAGRCRG
jgi:hypothetical protein